MDFSDVFSCLKSGTNHELMDAQGEGEEAAKKAIEKALKGFTNLKDAKSVIVNFELHPDYPMIELLNAIEVIENAVNDEAEILWGTSAVKSFDIGLVKVYVVVIL
jgi:cell division protein FtsZ